MYQGNKQQELVGAVQLESYDMISITETLWDESQNWTTAVEGYELFRMDKQGRKGEVVALYTRKWF